MSVDYEKIVHPNKTYALPHGASNPSQAALHSHQEQAKTQTKIINGGKKVVVPSFHGKSTTPYDSNHISRTTNHTSLQTTENGKYDHMVDAPPKQIPASQVRGGKRRRRRRRSKSSKSRRRSRRKHRSKSGKSRSRRHHRSKTRRVRRRYRRKH